VGKGKFLSGFENFTNISGNFIDNATEGFDKLAESSQKLEFPEFETKITTDYTTYLGFGILIVAVVFIIKKFM